MTAWPGALALLLGIGPAQAQRPPMLPRVAPVASAAVPLRNMPAAPVPTLPDVAGVRRAALPDLRLPDRPRLGTRAHARQLVRQYPALLDLDGAGALVVRSDVVAIDPSPASLARARDAGFQIGAERTFGELDLRIVVLRAPPAMGTRAALDRLRRADPGGEYDYNHLYRGSAAPAAAVAAATPASRPGKEAAPGRSPARIGLVDGGVAVHHPGLDAAAGIHTWGCGGRSVPDAHGTAVASLLLGGGGAPSSPTELYAADIYCGQPAGGAVTGLAEAMAWLAREQVGVVNLSLVGPHNALLQRTVAALARRGHVLVAAVGNDGPAAPPLFPAAYPEVIAVTAVDARGRVLPEAGRGRHVDFAALGHDLRAARPARDWAKVRGTSFAAPEVARFAARHVPRPAPGNDARVRSLLEAHARDLGRKGRDDTFGHGRVEIP